MEVEEVGQREAICTASPCTSQENTRCCGKRGRNGAPTELSDTAFRRVEKKYKLYQLPPRQARRRSLMDETDLTDVVNFRDVAANTPENQARIHVVRVADPDVDCYTFSGVPGLLIFPGVLSEEEQQDLCRDAVLSYGDSSRHPNILSTHAKTPHSTSCYQPPMRWSTLGFSYQWTSKTYARDCYSPFPGQLKKKMMTLMDLVRRVEQDEWHCCEDVVYEPQTAIVNYYPVGSMMMCHQDVSEEALDQPLVSVSLGCSAVFLMGTDSREDPPHAFVLRSGDVAAFTGPARTAFHATPRIFDDCPDYLTIADDAITPEESERYAHNTYHLHSRPDGGFEKVERDRDLPDATAQERYWRLCMRHMRVNVNARQVYAESCPFLNA